MAIKGKKDKAAPELPAELDDLCLRGFTFQQLCDAYEEKFKTVKGKVETYLKTTDDFEVTEGEGFKTPYGSIIYMGRSTNKYDNDAIIELIKSKKVSLEQVLSCVTGYKADELEKTLSSAVFETVCTKTETKSLTFRASSEFKEKVRSELDAESPTIAPIVEALDEVKPASAKPAKKESAADKAKAAKAALASKAAKKGAKKSATDDLDAILKGE